MLLGDTISEKNEKKSLDLATKICTSMTEETQQTLQKVFYPVVVQGPRMSYSVLNATYKNEI